MKRIMLIMAIFLGLSISKDLYADSDESSEPFFGKGKAIEEIKKDGNLFKLSKKSVSALGIQSIKVKVKDNNIYEVPTSSIVYFQDQVGVYKATGRWFELYKVKIILKEKNLTKISAKGLSHGDEIVFKGVALLRIANLQASRQMPLGDSD